MGHPGAPPSDNIYISDLPPQITKEECEAVLQAYGTVTQCRILPPKLPGQKSCALVRFSSVEEAQWIVDNLNGNLAEGLSEPISCRFANPPVNSWGKDGGGKGCEGLYGKGGGGKGCEGPYSKGGAALGALGNGSKGSKGEGKHPPRPTSFYGLYGAVKKAGLLGAAQVPQECMVYVRNLPTDTTDLDLFRLFSPFGAIAPSGCKAMQNEDGSCKGFGFVDYVDPSSCASAINTLNGFTAPEGAVLSVACKAPRKGKGKGKGSEDAPAA